MITKMAFVAHPVRDMEEAKAFYGDVLGLKASANYDDRWVEFQTPDGKTLALDTFSPQHLEAAIYLALETDDIDAEVARLKERGAAILRDVWTNKGPDGVEVCRMALVADPDQNVLMLHQIAAHRAG